MKVRSARLRGLMRRNVCGNEVHPSQLAPLTSGVGKRNMALVDRIESAAKKANVHLLLGLTLGWARESSDSNSTRRSAIKSSAREVPGFMYCRTNFCAR